MFRPRLRPSRLRSLLAGAVLGATMAWAGPASAVSFDWVLVGDPGNPCDPGIHGCLGAVASPYRISRYEVTNSQYAEFLNAKAASDPNGLYNPDMAGFAGGITRSGSPGSFTYSAIPGRENMPVNQVSFLDALRFVNWLHNGQGSADTENGAYTITTAAILSNSITRNAGATFFLPDDDEWYKAAYFTGTGYLDYPAGSNTAPTCSAPTAAPNHANCGLAVLDVTPVGAYTGSPSALGTFDQGGNVAEWTESVVLTSSRSIRGGSFFDGTLAMNADSVPFGQSQSFEVGSVGFRIASVVPEPATGMLLAAGMAMLGAVRGRRA